jgi:hypothetical protein
MWVCENSGPRRIYGPKRDKIKEGWETTQQEVS